jgi:nicotinamide riboside kinase
MKSSPAIYVITGAESTGKSALTEWLANYFNVPYIPEFARSYIENLRRPYTYEDVEEIAMTQIKQINEYKNTSYPFIFADTWLIITKVWFELVFGESPLWLENEIKNTPVNLFLVCDIDLPWIPDPVRENGGEKRVMLHKKYLEIIKENHFDYKIVSGKNSERYNNSLKIIKKKLIN